MFKKLSDQGGVVGATPYKVYVLKRPEYVASIF